MKMSTFIFIFIFLFFTLSDSLKIWIPNTDINNKLNWNNREIPKNCDSISFQSQTDVAAFWNLKLSIYLKKLVTSGLSLPQTGDIIFSQNIDIQFRNKDECPQGRDFRYIRNDVKGWLDPGNWKSDSEGEWVPHSEQVPCAGEPILFPPQRTFAVQLPSILVPINGISFDNEVFRGDTWSDFLKTELGFQLFKGPDDVRNIPWRNDAGCLIEKKCVCGRSSYSIRDGVYKETDLHIFEEAVCLYAMPKCQPSPCYSPVVPEGHCCGICGAVIKIEDNTREGLNISNIKSKVDAELHEYDSDKRLKTYVGRTKDENIQIVVIAENSDDTIKSHDLANIIRRKLTDGEPKTRISSRISGLRFSNYLFNSVSGAVFGTLMAVLVLFMSIYYIYLVLPKKKFYGSSAGNPFMFARFENLVNEEHLEIGIEAEAQQELPQAFDNPMYSGATEPAKESSKTKSPEPTLKESDSQILEGSSTKEYSNPIYSELEDTKKNDEFLENLGNDEEVFSEIKL